MQEGNLSPVGKFFRNKWVWLILAIDIVIIVSVIVALVKKTTETATLTFNITPIDVTISVNGSNGYENIGQPIEDDQNSGKTYDFTPGTYEIQISHPDLDTKTFTLDLKPNSNTTITTFLTDENFYYYKLRDNYGAFLALAKIASKEDNRTTDHDTSAEVFIDKFQKDYEKYLNDLPVSYSEHDERGHLTKYITIRADYDCQVTLCLKATLDKNDKNKVEDMLKEKGFNVEDYEIIYKFYE